ncbi:PRD domain-containing protein [uncultured Propionibacterium sp.]|uniref:BglG family transcription antiterminator n=1 Tax=uncultured Propionibacterium sp. TaxID=218066 RepID=UPI00292D6646|nr:HTH domain-containing protein [uncultured Propionibacterium sp.]
MNRRAEILLHLERHLSAGPEALQDRLGVGAKTITNDVHELNSVLGRAAQVRLDRGRYRLWVIDRDRYALLRTELVDGSASFNDPGTRGGHIIARLARATGPVLVDDLAREMSVGRSTVLNDLGTLRERSAAYGITIAGRPNRGLEWHGDELSRRLYILDHHYPAVYSGYPIDEPLLEPVDRIAAEYRVPIPSIQEITRWYTVMLDRTLTGHPLSALPDGYEAVRRDGAHDFGVRLVAAVSAVLQLPVDDNEAVFMTLPVIGMHTPHDQRRLKRFPASAEIRPLLGKILPEIAAQMGIEIPASTMLTAFAHHLTFMINRLRFGIRIGTGPSTDLRSAYPVAHQMATITAQVIDRELRLAVGDDEKQLLTGYFQVFIEEHRTLTAPAYRVGVVTRGGGVSARLTQLELAKVMADSTRYTLLGPDEATADVLDGLDLVITTTTRPLRTSTPTIRLAEVFDRDELLRHINRLRFDRGVQVMLGAGTRSLLAGLLTGERFTVLDPGPDYEELLAVMLDRFIASGQLPAGFDARIRERQERATMLISPEVAFPHAALPDGADRLVLAIGVVPRAGDEEGLRLIVLLGVPAKNDYDDTLLVDIYDEVIRLAADRAGLDRISRFTSYEQFFLYMTNNPAHLEES